VGAASHLPRVSSLLRVVEAAGGGTPSQYPSAAPQKAGISPEHPALTSSPVAGAAQPGHRCTGKEGTIPATGKEGTIPAHPQLPPELRAESTAEELCWKPRCCLSVQLMLQATEICCSTEKRWCLLTAHLPGTPAAAEPRCVSEGSAWLRSRFPIQM